MNRIDRLTGMILLLQGRRVITAEEISGHFEISVRTVYRDIGALGEAGVPIVAEAGVGYSLAKGYHMPPVMFTEDEAAALIMGVEVTDQVADDSLRRSIGGALLKIRSVLPADRRDYVARLEKAVNVHFGRAKVSSTGCDLMPMQAAIVRRRCVALRYDAGRRGEFSERVVEPLGMVFYSRQWHLIAWCRLRGDFRDFRLDRVESWKVLAETFDGHETFSVEKFLSHEREEGVEMISAKVKVDRDVLERFRNQAPCSPLQEELLEDGRVRVGVLVYTLDYLVGWLLSFGTTIEVESPSELTSQMRAAALAVAAQYPE